MSVTFTEIQRAAERLEGVVHRTPVLHSRQLDAAAGATVFLKCENLQRSGSFKIRGAYNAIAQLDEPGRARGVISYSSGNHAQGVALAASLLHVPATIVVPSTIPAAKRAATEGYGARVVVAGTTSEDRRLHAESLAEANGLTLVPPYDLAAIIAGQGTVALEFLSQMSDLDVLVTPVGGGGLLAGCASAARALHGRGLHIVGIEAEDANDTYLSLLAGHRIRIPPPATIADGMRALEPGKLTFPIVQALVDEIALVTDAEIASAVRFLLERTKILVEPTGGVGVAALLAGKIPAARGRRVGVVLSGGNVDAVVLARILTT
jgi:threonine dehydratase